MANKNIKEKALDALPYVAVAGIAIIGIYALTKLVEKATEIGDLDFDFGNDPNLTQFVGK
jgi:hypothetical protein